MRGIQEGHTTSFKIAELCRGQPHLKRLMIDDVYRQFKIHMDPFSRSVIALLKTDNINDDITTKVML